MKLVNITLIFKKKIKHCKSYRPVSALPCVSKVFERIRQKQRPESIEKVLFLFLFGYRKDFNTLTALFGLVKKWKASLEKNGYGDAILLDLPKGYDTINHELLLAKLNVYSFDKNSL